MSKRESGLRENRNARFTKTFQSLGKLNLSSRFIITFSTYTAFLISSELLPILKLTQLFIPIFVLVMLRERELKIMIAFDLSLTLLFIIRSIALVETFALALISFEGSPIKDLWAGNLFIIWGFMSSYLFNYFSAWSVIKKKKLRERATRLS